MLLILHELEKMLTKEESTAYNKEFWTQLHTRMRGIKSSNGRSIGWLNYPTDVKNTYLRLRVDKNCAELSYEIQFKDQGIRAIFWEQLEELRKVLENEIGAGGIWEFEAYNEEQRSISKIYWRLEKVNLYKKEDHPTIYDFFEKHLVCFDIFYQEFKEILIHLVR